MEDSSLLLRIGCAGHAMEDAASTSLKHECPLCDGSATNGFVAQSLRVSQGEQASSSLHAMEDSSLLLCNGHAGDTMEDTASTSREHKPLHDGGTTNGFVAQSLHASQGERAGSSSRAMEDSRLLLHNGRAMENAASTLHEYECPLRNGGTTNPRNT
jgi:hypothetical protein